MTIKELKSEIQKSLDNVPESVLEDILVLLKAAAGKDMMDIAATENDKFEFVLKSAQGTIRFDDIKHWIKSKLVGED